MIARQRNTDCCWHSPTQCSPSIVEILAPTRRPVHRLREKVRAWGFIHQQKTIGERTQNFPGGNYWLDLFIVTDRCVSPLDELTPEDVLLLPRIFDVLFNRGRRHLGFQ